MIGQSDLRLRDKCQLYCMHFRVSSVNGLCLGLCLPFVDFFFFFFFFFAEV